MRFGTGFNETKRLTKHFYGPFGKAKAEESSAFVWVGTWSAIKLYP